MKKIILLWAVAIGLWVGAVRAQNIVIGQKAPEIKNAVWLDGHRPAEAELTCIVFIHSSNRSSLEALRRVAEVAENEGGRMRVIAVTQEPAEKIGAVLRPYLSGQLGIVLDPEKRVFGAFGVHYVPLGVLTDAKNRVQWVGNPSQLKMEN